MIIDCHYHLEPRLESVERLVAQLERHRIDRVALMATLVEPFTLGAATHLLAAAGRVALQTRWLRGAGLLMYRSTVTEGGHFSVLGTRYAIYDAPDNDAVARVIAQRPDRFVGWVFVNPRAADPLRELERRFGAPGSGWIGVKAHPFWHRYPVRALDDTARWCAEQERPLLVHLGGDATRGDYRFLPRRHPRLRLIYAHGGVPYFQQLWDELGALPGVVVDLSGAYMDEPLRRRAVAALGPGRCLYGSDGPFGPEDRADGKYDHGAILAEIDRLPVGAADRERILGGNFRALASV